MNSKRIYIAGPMTDIDNYNFMSFIRAQVKLQNEGYDTVNPVEIVWRNGGTYAYNKDESIRRAIREEEINALKTCTGIYLLAGWEHSLGAKRELQIALENNLTIMLEE